MTISLISLTILPSWLQLFKSVGQIESDDFHFQGKAYNIITLWKTISAVYPSHNISLGGDAKMDILSFIKIGKVDVVGY